MIATFKHSDTLDRKKIQSIFDDTNRVSISVWICTEITALFSGVHEREADGTFSYFFFDTVEGFGELVHIRIGRFQQKKREFGRGLFSDARKIGYVFYKLFERFRHKVSDTEVATTS